MLKMATSNFSTCSTFQLMIALSTEDGDKKLPKFIGLFNQAPMIIKDLKFKWSALRGSSLLPSLAQLSVAYL